MPVFPPAFQNVKEQEMKTHITLYQEWRDYRLKWKPEDYGDLNFTVIQMNKVWSPDLTLSNNADSRASQHISWEGITGLLFHDGSIQGSVITILETFCEMDITKFPTDTQTCPLQITLWNYPSSQTTRGRGWKE
ncbi:acetylcholine receptor subunit alpha-like 1 [Glandiceps talaboti]